jgi:uncharacterized membrane protein YqgA involved in biofilm formation
MAANAPGLIAAGVPIRLVLPVFMGLLLAALAGVVAPPPTAARLLPLACLALVVIGMADRPRARATLAVLLAWLAGAVVGGLELVLEPMIHALAVGLATLVAVRLAARRGAGPDDGTTARAIGEPRAAAGPG